LGFKHVCVEENAKNDEEEKIESRTRMKPSDTNMSCNIKDTYASILKKHLPKDVNGFP